MNATLPALRLALISLAIASAFGSADAHAQSPAQPATPSDSARPRGPGGPDGQGPQLFTQEERNALRDKMRAAKTPEERQKLRDDSRAELERRAKEKGVTLPPPRAQRGESGRGGPGAQTDGQSGNGGPGARGDNPARNLLSGTERQQFRDKMHAAKTPEERTQARNEMRSTVEQRAKERGITLPEHRSRHGKGGPRGDSPAPGANPPNS